MKKLTLIAAFSLLMAAGAMAQTNGGSAPAQTTPTAGQVQRHEDEKNIRTDEKDIKNAKTERNQDLKEGHDKAAKTETKDIKNDKKNLKSDVKQAHHNGVKHPIKRANGK